MPENQKILDLAIGRLLVEQEFTPLAVRWNDDGSTFIVIDHTGRKTRHTPEAYQCASRQLSALPPDTATPAAPTGEPGQPATPAVAPAPRQPAAPASRPARPRKPVTR